MLRLPIRRLSYTKLGDGSGTPVIMCHGLLGNKNNFNNIGKMMSYLTDRPVITMDMLNHGSAAWTENGGYEFMAEEVKKAIDELCGGKAVVLGHSMGGRVAMWTALTSPELVENLMIVDVTANNWVGSPLQIKGFLKHMKDATVPEGLKRSEIRKHLDEYMTEVAPEVGIRNFLMTNLKIDKNGFRWKANVEYLYQKLDSEYASMEAVEGLEYLGDTILIGGANSDYIKWDERDEDLMTEFFPFIEYVNIPDAGHWVHAEKPEEFLEVCSKFLNTRIQS